VKGRDFPFVVLMGTSLSTGLCSSLAQKAKEVVEMNPEPVIEVGRVYQYRKDAVEVVKEMLKELGEKK
jgi:hypothetical protein